MDTLMGNRIGLEAFLWNATRNGAASYIAQRVAHCDGDRDAIAHAATATYDALRNKQAYGGPPTLYPGQWL